MGSAFGLARLARLFNSQPEEEEEDEESILRKLFSEQTPGMEAYRSHVSSPPNLEPQMMDKIKAVLSGLSTERRNRGQGLGVTQALLEQPRKRAMEDHNFRGKGLGDIAELDERRLGRKIQGETALEGIRARKEAATLTREGRTADNSARDEQRKLELEEKIRAAKERETDRDLDRDERKRASEERADLMRELATMRKETQEGQRDNKVGFFYDPEQNKNIPVSQGEAQARGLTKAIPEKEVNRETFLRTAKTDLEKALSYFKNNPGKTGQIQGNISKGKRALDMGDPELLANMNILESYTGESLREKGGTALTPTELAVFSPINPRVTQSDDHLKTNLEMAIKKLGEMTRNRSTSVPDEGETIEIPGVGKVIRRRRQ